jgi:hypothetical protein
MLISKPADTPTKNRSGRRWLIGIAILALLPPGAFAALLVISLLGPVQQWAGTRVYQLPARAAYPPPGVSGVSGEPGGWTRQNLRAGDWVVEWRWLARTRRRSSR